MNILVLCDDNWHPADVVKGGLEPLRTRGFDFHYILETDAEWQDSLERLLTEYDLLILAKSNRVSAVKEHPWIIDSTGGLLQRYVSAGGGLLVLHSGTVGYPDMEDMCGLIGGVFHHHPEQCPVTVEPVQDTEITRGIQAFTVQDEHYFMDMTDPTNVDIFMVTRSGHGEQPGGWTRMEGGGRVCVLTPGHNLAVWLHPGYQQLLQQALTWTASAPKGE
ncbi:type 1 glutamine amidotransferase [Paenibacillus rhizosphaerae]|uniref:Type 1 glutamine amidotransferase n=1 Tax=Paenibacillus rhizosphaerae TaxID=297318 RepID=A0A839TY87_9BACL|nr:ThuA domain-containing protein [Paenibacillus rhizosphaerae]MBB3129617.1 type 1 glutamine amidotransferase [Paenibacillus rhizosphaerae]